MQRRIQLILSCALALCTVAGPLKAQPRSSDTYPSKPIRLIVPFPAGSAPDTLARQLATPLSKSMSTTIEVDNVPGAGGTLGVARVTKSDPDGYTLLLSGDAALVLTGGNFRAKPPYDTLRELAPIAQIAITPNVLVVANEVPVSNVQELVALIRRQPAQFSYASSGMGLSQHRAGELMNSMAGLDMMHVPNSKDAFADVISGRVQLGFINIARALPMAREGKVRALAVSSKTRSSSAPELPTISESGLPGFESIAWFGLLAPVDTPRAVLQRLETETQNALATPALKERMGKMGAMPGASNAAQFTRVIQDDIKRWSETTSVASIKQP